MRKVLSIVLGFLMLFSTSALCEGIDFSAMNLDELVELQKQLYIEISSRVDVDDPSLIGTGKYSVGVTIKPGVYEFTATECTTEKLDGEYRCDITIYMFDDQTGKHRPWLTEVAAVGEKITIAISDGMWLEIDGGTGTLRELNPTWAP